MLTFSLFIFLNLISEFCLKFETRRVFNESKTLFLSALPGGKEKQSHFAINWFERISRWKLFSIHESCVIQPNTSVLYSDRIELKPNFQTPTSSQVTPRDFTYLAFLPFTFDSLGRFVWWLSFNCIHWLLVQHTVIFGGFE